VQYFGLFAQYSWLQQASLLREKLPKSWSHCNREHFVQRNPDNKYFTQESHKAQVKQVSGSRIEEEEKTTPRFSERAAHTILEQTIPYR